MDPGGSGDDVSGRERLLALLGTLGAPDDEELMSRAATFLENLTRGSDSAAPKVRLPKKAAGPTPSKAKRPYHRRTPEEKAADEAAKIAPPAETPPS